VTTSNAPTIERFDVTDNGEPGLNRYEVEWAVADAGGDLDVVVSLLRHKGETVSAQSTYVSGGEAFGTHTHEDRGRVDELVLVVNDTSNRVSSESKTL
jgi:hypothetical protein